MTGQPGRRLRPEEMVEDTIGHGGLPIASSMANGMVIGGPKC